MPQREPAFSVQALLDRIRDFPPCDRLVVGYSGGADSTALLSALHDQRPRLGASLAAVHFNHGLHAAANDWQRHCEQFCARRDIALDCHALCIDPQGGSLESRARSLRYRTIADHLDERTIYLTGHTADDRAETFLLHALRGSGLEGLSSIPALRRLGPGFVARPLLEFSRQALLRYLADQGLDWIEDPSNQDARHDRNFIRHEVMPLLESRWPSARATLARTAQHVLDASAVLDELLRVESRLDTCDPFTLPLQALGHNDAAATLIVRAWLRRHGAPSLPRARLEEFLAQLRSSGHDSQCEARWAGWALCRFRDEIHLRPPGDCPPCPQREWRTATQLDLGPELGSLRVAADRRPDDEPWSVGPRRPGARMQLDSGTGRRKLKKLYQELQIPPWQRQSIPVLYWNGEPVAVGDWLLAPRMSEWLDRNRAEYRWTPGHPALRETQASCHARRKGRAQA